MSSIRVLFFFNRFYPSYGGAAIYVKNFVPYLHAKEIETVVLTSNIQGRPPTETIGEVKIKRIGTLGRTGRLRGLVVSLHAVGYLLRHRNDYDLVHWGDASGGVYFAIPILMLLKKPIVVESTLLGSDDGMAVKHQRFGSLKLNLLQLSSAISVVSTALYDSYMSAGFLPSKVHLLPYGIDTQKFTPVRQEEKAMLRQTLGLSRNAKIAVFVGGINRRKAVDFLVRAIALVVKTEPDALLLLVGPRDKEGYQGFATELDGLINDLDVRSSVQFAGNVENVVDFLRAADVYVTASTSEGLPLGTLEAMACGLPSVVIRLPGITDLIFDTETGVVVDDRSAEVFADRLSDLMHDIQRREAMGTAARHRVERSFNIELRAQQFRDLYVSLL